MRLAGRRILVTGAARGIGRAIASLFLEEGAAVALCDRDAEALRAAQGALAARPGRAATVVADVTSERDVQAAVGAADAALDGLDGVVNAAGIDLLKPFAEMPLADWNRVLEVNLTGPMLVIQAALPAIERAGGGTIVNIASGAALRPLNRRSAYCAAKAGLVMLSKTLALELAARNVRVNALCPGAVDTPLFRASWEQAAEPRVELAAIVERYAQRRIGTVEEIAAAALFLTSGESSLVTGVALAADGGRSFH